MPKALGRNEWGVFEVEYRVSFGGNENVLKLGSAVGCTILNILKTTKMYTLRKWIEWYANYVSIKLLF